MEKYYKVFLIDDSKNTKEDYSTIEENYAICKEAPVGFKELVTEKDIYPRETGISIPALTFGSIPSTLHNYHSQTNEYVQGKTVMIAMTAKDVLIWWSSMNENSLKEYVEKINRLEELAINKHCGLELIEQNKIKLKEERKSNKIIKRILKQIKKR